MNTTIGEDLIMSLPNSEFCLNITLYPIISAHTEYRMNTIAEVSTVAYSEISRRLENRKYITGLRSNNHPLGVVLLMISLSLMLSVCDCIVQILFFNSRLTGYNLLPKAIKMLPVCPVLRNLTKAGVINVNYPIRETLIHVTFCFRSSYRADLPFCTDASQL